MTAGRLLRLGLTAGLAFAALEVLQGAAIGIWAAQWLGALLGPIGAALR